MILVRQLRSFLLGIFQELLIRELDTTREFSKVDAVKMGIPISNVCTFQMIYILGNN